MSTAPVVYSTPVIYSTAPTPATGAREALGQVWKPRKKKGIQYEEDEEYRKDEDIENIRKREYNIIQPWQANTSSPANGWSFEHGEGTTDAENRSAFSIAQSDSSKLRRKHSDINSISGFEICFERRLRWLRPNYTCANNLDDKCFSVPLPNIMKCISAASAFSFRSYCSVGIVLYHFGCCSGFLTHTILCHFLTAPVC